MQRTHPKKKTSRKSSIPEVVPSKTPTTTASAGGSKVKVSCKTANADLLLNRGLGGYIPEIVKEFYAALPGEVIKDLEVTVSVRGLKFEFSPAAINQFLDLSPLQGDEIDVDLTMNEVSNEELASFLTEGTRELTNLTTKYMSPCKADLVILSAYNWVPSSHKNAVSVDRARLIYKMFHGIRVDVGEMIYSQVLNLGVIQKKEARKTQGG
ncbi:hypothetical protein DY000_02053893 [Brassica cretica]|uniref:Putative plant transposon protein domain-containing protein n=1 Tax=Brassica cretica TaxID=69181 RepID=A0ABQ7AM95_BRACR|nr:hypothetical protein DY000_02053893 [Brassica cretica]